MPKRNYHIQLTGYVGGPTFNSESVKEKLSAMKDTEVLVLIDSYGGSVATALSISDAFGCHENVRVHFVGMNASAATIASMGAKHISIDRNAMYLVHKSSQAFFEWCDMNADQLESKIKEFQKAKADLEKIDLNIAAMYASRCNRPVDELLNLMKEGAWLNAREAKEWGFVDEITEFPEDNPATLDEVQARVIVGAGQPLPNMPIIGKGEAAFFKRLEAFFSNLLNGFNNKVQNMKKVFNSVCNLLALDAIEFKNGFASVSEEQFAKLEGRISELEASVSDKENALNDKAAEIEALKAEILDLKKKPGDSSKSVVDNQKKSDKGSLDSKVDDFINVQSSAVKMFNAIP